MNLDFEINQCTIALCANHRVIDNTNFNYEQATFSTSKEQCKVYGLRKKMKILKFDVWGRESEFVVKFPIQYPTYS